MARKYGTGRGFRHAWFGLPRRYWFVMLGLVAAGVTLAVAYDPAVDAVSRVTSEMTGRVIACGPPGQPLPTRARRATVALDDGRRLTVNRFAEARPSCGATVRVTDRTTPWGTTYHRIE